MTNPLNNVNYRLLLEAHGGNVQKARAAWDKIRHLGKFGNVPFEYEGGLDVGGMRVVVEERRQNQSQATAFTLGSGRPAFEMQTVEESVEDYEDRIKRIEDIAAGDNPYI